MGSNNLDNWLNKNKRPSESGEQSSFRNKLIRGISHRVKQALVAVGVLGVPASAHAQWETPTEPVFNEAGYINTTPFVERSGDTITVYYSSNRPGSAMHPTLNETTRDIWKVESANQGIDWGTPVLVPGANSNYDEYYLRICNGGVYEYSEWEYGTTMGLAYQGDWDGTNVSNLTWVPNLNEINTGASDMQCMNGNQLWAINWYSGDDYKTITAANIDEWTWTKQDSCSDPTGDIEGFTVGTTVLGDTIMIVATEGTPSQGGQDLKVFDFDGTTCTGAMQSIDDYSGLSINDSYHQAKPYLDSVGDLWYVTDEAGPLDLRIRWAKAIDTGGTGGAGGAGGLGGEAGMAGEAGAPETGGTGGASGAGAGGEGGTPETGGGAGSGGVGGEPPIGGAAGEAPTGGTGGGDTGGTGGMAGSGGETPTGGTGGSTGGTGGLETGGTGGLETGGTGGLTGGTGGLETGGTGGLTGGTGGLETGGTGGLTGGTGGLTGGTGGLDTGGTGGLTGGTGGLETGGTGGTVEPLANCTNRVGSGPCSIECFENGDVIMSFNASNQECRLVNNENENCWITATKPSTVTGTVSIINGVHVITTGITRKIHNDPNDPCWVGLNIGGLFGGYEGTTPDITYPEEFNSGYTSPRIAQLYLEEGDIRFSDKETHESISLGINVEDSDLLSEGYSIIVDETMLDGESCLLDAFEGRENLSEINPSEPPKDGGCGCSIPGKASNSGFAGLVLAGIAIAASRFRRRKEEEE